jgi:hypothetical protein
MECLPWVVSQKMAAIPVLPDLYGSTVDADDWEALRHWLHRERKAGRSGDYVRIPIAEGEYLVVSDAEIGSYIDRAIVEDYMLKSATAWGSITRSDGWTPVQTQAPEGFQDEGICTQRLPRITAKLALMDLPDGRIGEHTFSYQTTDAQHEQLRRICGVISDADFWAERRESDLSMRSARTIISRVREERAA